MRFMITQYENWVLQAEVEANSEEDAMEIFMSKDLEREGYIPEFSDVTAVECEKIRGDLPVLPRGLPVLRTSRPNEREARQQEVEKYSYPPEFRGGR